MMIHEEVGIFLFILAHGVGNRLAQDMFQHSGETISRHFHKVLDVVRKLSEEIIKPDSNYNVVVPEYIRTSSKYYPLFKDCIGAIDGTRSKLDSHKTNKPNILGERDFLHKISWLLLILTCVSYLYGPDGREQLMILGYLESHFGD
ncbi:hypothetical protein RJ640_008961 [Escallonia rubra]|uniref:DUF8040 domain-containing protein n=1 Tax=Escallonia rubra TaxID=112253 RepID=A0AA88UP10_9ASTE|nr:hypothetical protein RJ640_008961 [Escallonia rubra]